jgi:hypothetical protein
MGEAYTAMEGAANMIFYNPASIASVNTMFDVSANYFEWIADISHASLSFSYRPEQGEYGVFGLSVQSISYGEVQGTMVWSNPQGYIDTEILEPSAVAIGIGYGRELSDRFIIGGQAKWVAQNLGKSVIPGEGTKSNVADVISFDFGTLYRTGFKSLAFGMSVRNFAQEIRFEEEGFQLPLTFKIGLSMNALDFTNLNPEQHAFLVLVDAAHPRSKNEYISVGGEYIFNQTFAVRMGYVTGHDEQDFTAGFGLQQFGFYADYAYTPFGVFDSVHRFSLRFTY